MLPPQVNALIDTLHARDDDPSFADAPVLDVYGRISINPETGETEKVDRQIEDTLREVLRRRARLGEVLRDDGKSAWKAGAKRPGWERLLTRLETRRAAGVVAWHTDRLMRQPRDLERLIGFGDSGLLVASCHGDFNLASSDDRFTLRILTAAAAKASDDTSRRQRRKMAALREQGKKTSGPRYFGMPGSYCGVQATPELVEAEREAIAWGVRAHLDGISLGKIAAEWNARGLRTVRGNLWQARRVAEVLKKPRVAGLLTYQGTVVGRYTDYEPIVAEDEHETLRARFETRKSGRPPTNGYLLSGGLLICGRCGNNMSGRPYKQRLRPDGTPRMAYRCVIRDIGSDQCGRMGIDLYKVEAEVRAMVVRTLADPAHARQVARTSAKLAAAQAKLDNAKNDAVELAKRLGEGRLSLTAYDAACEPLNKRIAKLTAEADALREAGGGTAARQATLEEVTAEWDSGDVDTRRALIRRMAPRGLVLLVPPEGRAPHTIPAKDRIAVI